MYIRNSKGKLVNINLKIYNSEKKMYEELWKNMFNIKVKSSKITQKEMIIDYLKNK
tara:strand:- start:3749 stop:3916 length:168 start_codon:yes stop_codon:yes gene_type:complete